MIKIEYNLEYSDYLLFNEYHLFNSASGKSSLAAFKCMLPFIAFMCIFIFLIARADPLLILIETIAFFIASILWIVFSKKLILYIMKKNIKKLSEQGKLPFSKEGVLIFDHDFINDIGMLTETKTRYSSIEKFCITEKAFYIYFSATQAFIVPTSVFSTDSAKQSFINFINEKISDSL